MNTKQKLLESVSVQELPTINDKIANIEKAIAGSKRTNTTKELMENVYSFVKRADNMDEPFFKTWCKRYKERMMETNSFGANGTAQGFGSGGAPSTAGEVEMGVLRGQTTGDASGAGTQLQVAATLEIYNFVIRGFQRYMDDTFVKKYTTDQVVTMIPLTEYVENVTSIGAGAAGQFEHTEKKITYATVNLSSPESEKGGKITWTRALLEDVTFDIQAEMAEGLGHAIAVTMMKDILGATSGLGSVTGANMPNGSIITIGNPILWTDFLSVVGAVDIGVDTGTGGTKTYGPADYCLVSTDVYWQLLNIIQATNVLYEGSTDPINKGVIKLALGTTILKESLLQAGTIYAVNSQKAIALVTRRALKIEPVLFPAWNEYGFIGSVRYGVTPLFSAAIQKGSTYGS
jgi:hypothetical protein